MPAELARSRGRARPRATLLVPLAIVALAALSLLGPSIPTYDPFSWIIWGREIAHGELVTSDGPSWKPLPVAFTTVFSLLGGAAPLLWVLVARIGALGALVAMFLLVRRLGGGVAGGVAAVAALGVAHWWVVNAGLGNSEGLMVMLMLLALERMHAERHGQAFAAFCGAALLRPESWPFLSVYGLWLMWRRRLPWPIVIGSGAAVLSCWLVPEYLGSGDLMRAANRARTDIKAGAPTYADLPALALIEDAAAMVSVPALIGLAIGLVRIVRTRDRAGGAIAGLAVLWLALVAVMTSDGFSGNQRYLIVPVALLLVIAGLGLGWAARALAGRRAALAAIVLAALMIVPEARKLPGAYDRVAYDERLTEALPSVIERVGGVAAIERCGEVTTGPFLVPQLAWHLNRPLNGVHALTPHWPGATFQVRTGRRSDFVPEFDRRRVPGVRRVVDDPSWRVYLSCRKADR